jgi:hypothetical protein
MLQRVFQWALAICVGATIAVEAVGQTSTAAPADQTGSSVIEARATSVAAPRPEIPESTWIELSITDWGPLQKAATGTIVPLVVTQDVVVDGVKAIEAGTRLSGVIAKQKQGSHWMNSDGRMEIQAEGLKSAGPIPIDRRSVREALHGPKPIPNPRASHALKVLAISTGTGLVIGLLGNDQQTGSRAAEGVIGAGCGFFIGTIINLATPPAYTTWGLPH